jgi:hypothetical protein
LSIASEEGQAIREQIQARLVALREQFETGQTELQKVEAQRVSLHETMLRISGAMQVLEELLAASDPAREDGTVTGKERSAGSDEEPGTQRAKT